MVTLVAKKLYIKTYGCQMNVYDTVRMTDVLTPLGYKTVDSPEGADMVILNTCHIREKASEKVFSELGLLRRMKDKREAAGERMLIGVAGCVAQAEGEEILRRVKQVDMVFGPQTYHRLPEMVTQALGNTSGRGISDTDFPVESKFDFLPEESNHQGPAAFLSVQEGCDKFCTFCVVPYTRGAEFSRPVASILEEARRLVANGTREITLLGQNVNGFHGEAPDGSNWKLGRLLRELAEIDGLGRLRYTTSHPNDMDDELIATHADLVSLMPYMHLPIQSGSDRILEMMNRKHTADKYRGIIDKLRTAVPGLSLSSDFIVGFPGETDQDFADTLRLVTDVSYAQSYSFKYSPRPGTPAAGIEAQVPEDVKSRRLAMLQELLSAQHLAFNQGTVGKTLSVLLERKGRAENQLGGRSPYMQSVFVKAPERLMGQVVDVKIETANPNSLTGTVVTGDYESVGAQAANLTGTGMEVRI
ncbi:tRNA (N6-isopentenyl adenosine(37)-C2)-methylthiotransferase MiaB [Kiloniella laminariae]|uniref:tRNA (N6-isopentenyl adenosine(37)-C2)-methylthiotransferase MiaB n=1 Tax=Kiloniella laminariae TaxID=454162 RepID=UPI000364D776